MTKQKNVRIVSLKVGERPKIEIIENTLSNLQSLVGGYIEVVYLDKILMIVNEEGKLENLKPNFVVPHDVIVGDVFFIGDDGEEFRSLTDEETVIGYLGSIGRCDVMEMIEDGLLRKIIEEKVMLDD
jgi:hypothetical protein